MPPASAATPRSSPPPSTSSIRSPPRNPPAASSGRSALLFQIISQRYERAPMLITTNRAYKHWSQIFNNDSTLTSAILDRVLHHAETVIIEGKSFRTKKDIDE